MTFFSNLTRHEESLLSLSRRNIMIGLSRNAASHLFNIFCYFTMVLKILLIKILYDICPLSSDDNYLASFNSKTVYHLIKKVKFFFSIMCILPMQWTLIRIWACYTFKIRFSLSPLSWLKWRQCWFEMLHICYFWQWHDLSLLFWCDCHPRCKSIFYVWSYECCFASSWIHASVHCYSRSHDIC